ncbi:ABC transporter permease [Paenibacillus eucommiae]|uniref:Iron(III) transport system permease protein n=1 Tax=Paenibacillus eucommiae TaxID=1355755 RepID=A0ABS4J9X9_9BACL|nr:iron ABC transporter permease [Paenibacillus eucommiae]MBP1996649.1 iron(III) transport system permease protein [Paenibacillus eucommiae]
MRFSDLLRNLRRNRNGWVLLSVIGAILALLPSLYILSGLFQKPNENWQHIRTYMLQDYALQSLLLVLGTGFFTVLVGVTLAWLVAAYEFPLRKFFSWAFVLPLAIPPYIAAYTYGSMLSYTGSIQTFMRNVLGWTPNQQFFDIMSMKGAIFIFTLFLFPYVYLITKTFLEKQSASFIENARLLGKNPLHIFFRVVLPISQAAIVGGVSLVAFEVLNDFGVTKHFGIQSFTTAIFKTWFGMYDVDSAIRLAALLMSAIIGLFVIERLLRRRRRYNASTAKASQLQRRRLRGMSAYAAFFFSALICSFSFFIPVVQLIVWAKWTYQDVMNAKFAELIVNTVFISLVSITVLIVFAVIVANVSRSGRSIFTLALSKVISMGYSIPGAVLSIGVLAVFISLDHQLSGVYESLGWGANKLVLSMSLAMLVFAYIIRFLAVGYNAVEAGYEKTGNRYSEASRLLGMGMTRTFFKVDLPLIKGSVLTGCILAFMEIVKELPLTLLLRPFNFDTLATKAYQYASDEQIHQASVPSLFIIGVGMISVFFYHWLGEKNTK